MKSHKMETEKRCVCKPEKVKSFL